MKIVTAGSAYADIDAYAGCIAYAELLRKQGHDAQAVITAVLNESIPQTLRNWPVELATNYTPDPHDTFTLIDISHPEKFETFVDLTRIDRIVDHHPGLKEYWEERIGKDHTFIELLGAACTQVYEFWKAAGLLEQMSETSARLLMCGILDNTLNFGASITTDRDRAAYDDLVKLSGLSADWPAQYFSECEQAILADPVTALKNDTKTLEFKTFTERMRVGQLVIWDGAGVLQKAGQALEIQLSAANPYWFINVVSISEGKSYFMARGAVKAWLSELLDLTFDGDVAVADRMWLRKEIMYEDQQTVEL